MEEIVPTRFELAQNYPNPFKEKTTIKYCVPGRMNIRLEVYDSKGNKLKTLIDEIKEAGTYKVEFNVSSAAGEPSTGSGQVFVQTKKMIWLK